MDYELKDNELMGQYEIRVDGKIAKIEYKKNMQKQIFLTHTEVPKLLEGKGVGAILVKLTLEDIAAKRMKLVPTCPFVAAYIRNNPEWKVLFPFESQTTIFP